MASGTSIKYQDTLKTLEPNLLLALHFLKAFLFHGCGELCCFRYNLFFSLAQLPFCCQLNASSKFVSATLGITVCFPGLVSMTACLVLLILVRGNFVQLLRTTWPHSSRCPQPFSGNLPHTLGAYPFSLMGHPTIQTIWI